MGDVTYLLPPQPTLPFSPVPLPAEEEEAPLAALFLRSIHLRRNIESQEFIHAGGSSGGGPTCLLSPGSQTDRQREGGGNFHFHFPPYYSHMRRNNPP